MDAVEIFLQQAGGKTWEGMWLLTFRHQIKVGCLGWFLFDAPPPEAKTHFIYLFYALHWRWIEYQPSQIIFHLQNFYVRSALQFIQDTEAGYI